MRDETIAWIEYVDRNNLGTRFVLDDLRAAWNAGAAWQATQAKTMKEKPMTELTEMMPPLEQEALKALDGFLAHWRMMYSRMETAEKCLAAAHAVVRAVSNMILGDPPSEFPRALREAMVQYDELLGQMDEEGCTPPVLESEDADS